ncbi:MAG: prepilin peptidase [Nitrospiraceae bacterium]|nr:prepilin peptidase [Nitrospiraceae bacterium]
MITMYVIIFIFGSLVGSFLNVCIYRLPKQESIVMPFSYCPSCKTPIKAWDNIPILSYLFLRSKCRACKEKISFRYPVVEALNALFYCLLLWRFGIGLHLLTYFALVSSLIVITFIDLDYQIIPDSITLPGVVLGLILGSFLLPDPFSRWSPLGYKASLIGAVTGFGLYYLIAVLSKGGMGGGDIKMMAMLGAFMGWKSVLLTTFSGSFLGAIWGISLMIFEGKSRKTKIPFGPFLAAGALITLFYGQEILYLYLKR